MTWPEFCRSNQFKGYWVAIDNCRYDQFTHQPVEGDVVDSDEELSELCARMREAGQSSCTIVYCETDVLIEAPKPAEARPSERRSAN
jgi:hypothetical protein